MSRISKQQALCDFAIALQREIVIRCGTFTPATEQERTWARQGAGEPFELDTFQRALGVSAAVA